MRSDNGWGLRRTDIGMAVLLLLVPYVAGVLAVDAIEHGLSTAAFLLPLCVLGTIVFLCHLHTRDPFELGVMLLGILGKIMGAILYIELVMNRAGGADALGYFTRGAYLAHTRGIGTMFLLTQPMVNTNFLFLVSGLLIRLFGPSLMLMVCLFTIAAFWGQYLFYRAFRVAFPESNHRVAAVLLFLFPSLLYWTSTIGKDALMSLALGLITYGVARLWSPRHTPSWVTLIGGLALATFVRPHICALVVMSIGISVLFGRFAGRRRASIRLISMPLVLAFLGLAMFALSAKVGAIDADSIASASDKSFSGNLKAASAFGANASPAQRVAMSPFVLLRPFPWEANNLPALVTACEGTLLGLAIAVNWRRFASLIYRQGRSPFLLFAFTYIAISAVTFSILMSNFGLLARERVMVLPLLLMLLAGIQPPRVPVSEQRERAATAAASWSRFPVRS